ncbi:Rz-like lysis system protein LysB [Collimonas fungivorans]|uniref:Putative lysis protein n=1 Tax=Collimonas fungivorans (strain Ter331) TaxID=1005048 RepID=G0AIQ1_COLFT|nr:Rz-like lysis system protein LysB [Collimonas fungivorans]AEK60834.1 putative lysis protein [Collimonas fungivorans Ter331]
MELIVKSLITALLVGVLGVVIWIQRDALIAEKARTDRAEQAISDKDDAIKSLTEAAKKNKVSLSKLQADREGIAATLTERERTIENLQHENAAIRSWADTPLPDAIAGMRDHAAITGADDYRQRMPASNTMQPTGGRAED